LPTRRLAHSLKTATSCFLYAPPHPDRLSSRFIRRLALWVATSATAKKYCQRTGWPYR
jgi:hypothetical protein